MVKSKYSNKKTEVDGITFDSKAEAKRYVELKLLEDVGYISDLELQKSFALSPSCIINGRKKPSLKYVADFYYTGADGNKVVEDVKGALTPVYMIKRHLMKTTYMIDILETK